MLLLLSVPMIFGIALLYGEKISLSLFSLGVRITIDRGFRGKGGVHLYIEIKICLIYVRFELPHQSSSPLPVNRLPDSYLMYLPVYLPVEKNRTVV